MGYEGAADDEEGFRAGLLCPKAERGGHTAGSHEDSAVQNVSWTLHRIGPGCPPAHGRSTLHELGEPSHSEPPTDMEIMAPMRSGAMAPA